jgi:hypothetical protein
MCPPRKGHLKSSSFVRLFFCRGCSAVVEKRSIHWSAEAESRSDGGKGETTKGCVVGVVWRVWLGVGQTGRQSFLSASGAGGKRVKQKKKDKKKKTYFAWWPPPPSSSSLLVSLQPKTSRPCRANSSLPSPWVTCRLLFISLPASNLFLSYFLSPLFARRFRLRFATQSHSTLVTHPLPPPPPPFVVLSCFARDDTQTTAALDNIHLSCCFRESPLLHFSRNRDTNFQAATWSALCCAEPSPTLSV